MPYVKEVFDVYSLEQAKHVVLTSEIDKPNKFEYETQYLINNLKLELDIKENTKILDYGCGMGRVSRELVNQFNCDVIGLDISDSMLRMADLYVLNPSRFKTCHEYNELESIDVILAILVLQHAEDPATAIKNIVDTLKVGGYFVLLNENTRYVPNGIDNENYVIWENDNFDVFSEVEKYLTKVKDIRYLNTDKYITFYRKDK